MPMYEMIISGTDRQVVYADRKGRVDRPMQRLGEYRLVALQTSCRGSERIPEETNRKAKIKTVFMKFSDRPFSGHGWVKNCHNYFLN